MASFLSDADLNIAQTAWGDSGVYVCTVSSAQDLSGNGEDYTELIVLGKIRSFIDILFFYLHTNPNLVIFCHLYASFSFPWWVVGYFKTKV